MGGLLESNQVCVGVVVNGIISGESIGVVVNGKINGESGKRQENTKIMFVNNLYKSTSVRLFDENWPCSFHNCFILMYPKEEDHCRDHCHWQSCWWWRSECH